MEKNNFSISYLGKDAPENLELYKVGNEGCTFYFLNIQDDQNISVIKPEYNVMTSEYEQAVEFEKEDIDTIESELIKEKLWSAVDIIKKTKEEENLRQPILLTKQDDSLDSILEVDNFNEIPETDKIEGYEFLSQQQANISNIETSSSEILDYSILSHEDLKLLLKILKNTVLLEKIKNNSDDLKSKVEALLNNKQLKNAIIITL